MIDSKFWDEVHVECGQDLADFCREYNLPHEAEDKLIDRLDIVERKVNGAKEWFKVFYKDDEQGTYNTEEDAIKAIKDSLKDCVTHGDEYSIWVEHSRYAGAVTMKRVES